MKLKHLEKISHDAYHGVMWLKQDSVNTGFKETVYPPIMTNIKMNSFQVREYPGYFTIPLLLLRLFNLVLLF